MEKFIARYNRPQLLGFDFDIEAGQSEQVIANLVKQIHGAVQRHPHLRMSFTLAAMKAIAHVGLNNHFINLMVMNFGEAKPENCVIEGTRCAMAASAIVVARNFSREYGRPCSGSNSRP